MAGEEELPGFPWVEGLTDLALALGGCCVWGLLAP